MSSSLRFEGQINVTPHISLLTYFDHSSHVWSKSLRIIPNTAYHIKEATLIIDGLTPTPTHVQMQLHSLMKIYIKDAILERYLYNDSHNVITFDPTFDPTFYPTFDPTFDTTVTLISD